MSAFDRIRRKYEDADKAERERKKKEEAEFEKIKKEYRKYEGLVVGVLKKMYRTVYQPRLRARGREGYSVRYEPRITAYAIGANLDFEYGYSARVTVRLGTDVDKRATHFICEVSGGSTKIGHTNSLNKGELEELLAKLYEESGGI